MPNSAYRRTLEELKTLYSLEKEIRDVYVEGLSDKKYLEWYLNQIGIKDPSIYEISDIDIDKNMICKNYENNNRDRIIVLIKCLNRTKLVGKYLGIIDRDILAYTRGLEDIENLIYTDFSCMEMYSYNDFTFKKINALGFSGVITNDIISFVNEVLLFTSSIRIYEKRFKKNMEKIKLDKYISYKKSKLLFEKDKYSEAIINKNNLNKDKKKILKKWEEINIELNNDDIRQFSNGHDMISLVNIILKKLDIVETHINDNIIKSLIVSANETEHILKEKLIKTLSLYLKGKKIGD